MVLLRTCLFACLGGFLFGYDLGLIGGALLQIQHHFGIRSSLTLELIVGAAKLGAAAGAFLGGAAMCRYGRQRALALNAAAFTVGPLLMAVAPGTWLLVLGRFVTGLGIGMSAIVSPAYIAELAPAHTRGALVQLYEVMLCVGMLSSSLVDWALSSAAGGWRLMVGLPALPGLALVAAPLLLPESPRWLVTKGRLDEALATLTTLMTGATTRQGGGAAPGWRWFAGYMRLDAKDSISSHVSLADDRALQAAEDELLLLWSAVEVDKNAVLERRRQLWKQRRQQRQEGQGALFHGHNARFGGSRKPPGLAPIPEESNHSLGLLHDELQPQGPGVRVDRQDSRAQDTSHPLLPNSSRSVGGDHCAEAGPSGPDETGLRGSWSAKGVEISRDQAARAASESDSSSPSRYSPLEGHDASKDERVSLLASGGHASGVRPDSSRGAEEAAQRHSSSGGASTSGMLFLGEEPTFLATLLAMLQDIRVVAAGPEARALLLSLGLAFFNQATASTAIINYAPSLLRRLGTGTDDGGAILYTVGIGVTKAIGVGIALLTVDHFGRRPLLIAGALACASTLALGTGAALSGSAPLLVAAMAAFIFFFSLSWAGLYWVVVSELFSMTSKSPGSSAATGLLFFTGAVTDLIFLSVEDALGPYVFLPFAAISAASAVYVWIFLPETKGKTLAEIQAMMKRGRLEGHATRHGSEGAEQTHVDGYETMWSRTNTDDHGADVIGSGGQPWLQLVERRV